MKSEASCPCFSEPSKEWRWSWQ